MLSALTIFSCGSLTLFFNKKDETKTNYGEGEVDAASSDIDWQILLAAASPLDSDNPEAINGTYYYIDSIDHFKNFSFLMRKNCTFKDKTIFLVRDLEFPAGFNDLGGGPFIPLGAKQRSKKFTANYPTAV